MMAVNSSKRTPSGKGRAGGPRPTPKRRGQSNEVAVEELIDAVKADAKTLTKMTQSRLSNVSRRTWWLVIMMLAAVVLAWAALIVVQHWEETRGLVLHDALAAPYDIEARAYPALDTPAEAMLSVKVGDYTLLTAAPEAEASSDAQAAEAPPAIQFGLLETCLLEAGLADASCSISYRPVRYATGAYARADGAHRVNVVVAQFYDEAQAVQAMSELFDFSRATGRTGNYALARVRPVDYFYSNLAGRYAFAWSSGPYIYAAVGANVSDVNQLVEKFPY
ncbi:MAG: hypothetical protein M5R40_08185 [Anaerolineae bacterium]|nr:hypothetical protein [Anaerolineae bacterium]